MSANEVERAIVKLEEGEERLSEEEAQQLVKGVERMNGEIAKLKREIALWRDLAQARDERVRAVEKERQLLVKIAEMDGGGDSN